MNCRRFSAHPFKVVYTLYYFPAKKGEKTEKCQRGLKTASKTSCLVSEFFYYTGQKCSKWVKPNNTGQKIGKKGFN